MSCCYCCCCCCDAEIVCDVARGGSQAKHESCRITRSPFNKWIHSDIPEEKPIAPLIVTFPPLFCSICHPRIHTRTHISTVAPRNELERDICYTRRGPRCVVARRQRWTCEVARRTGEARADAYSREHPKTWCDIIYIYILYTILCGFPMSCVALALRKAIPSSHVTSRDFQRPDHAPRRPAGSQNCA